MIHMQLNSQKQLASKEWMFTCEMFTFTAHIRNERIRFLNGTVPADWHTKVYKS